MTTSDQSDLLRRAFSGLAKFAVALALLLFVPAWTLAFWQAWLFLAVFCGACLVVTPYFIKRDPGLVRRRMAAGPVAEKEPAQRRIMTLASICFALLIVVPALDHHWHWSQVPAWLAIAGDIGVLLSFLMITVVLRQNSYAASTIQVEPGQPVVSTGLYAVVRHPMYAAALPMFLFTPLALGSYWGLLPFAAILPAFVWRLLDEEKFLARNLPGYAGYQRKVRYRLIPLVW